MSPRRNRRRFRPAGLATLALLALAGCRTEMYDQPRNETFTETSLFANRSSARPLVAGTVARGWSMEDQHLFNGRVDGKLAETFPFEVDRAILERGRQRYEIYCTPCHDGLGTGNGMIVQRGFSPPPTFHSDRLRTMPVGHFFDVQTRGYGAMYSYAARIKPADRWAIAAYIRVLQQSQNAPEGELSPADLAQLQEAAR
jgi:mono/diheme cytochrome c family protein